IQLMLNIPCLGSPLHLLRLNLVSHFQRQLYAWNLLSPYNSLLLFQIFLPSSSSYLLPSQWNDHAPDVLMSFYLLVSVPNILQLQLLLAPYKDVLYHEKDLFSPNVLLLLQNNE